MTSTASSTSNLLSAIGCCLDARAATDSPPAPRHRCSRSWPVRRSLSAALRPPRSCASNSYDGSLRSSSATRAGVRRAHRLAAAVLHCDATGGLATATMASTSAEGVKRSDSWAQPSRCRRQLAHFVRCSWSLLSFDCGVHASAHCRAESRRDLNSVPVMTRATSTIAARAHCRRSSEMMQRRPR